MYVYILELWPLFLNVQILKKAICTQMKYKPSEFNLLSYLPRIEIAITKVPEHEDSEPLELSVEGLNVPSVFQLSPGTYP